MSFIKRMFVFFIIILLLALLAYYYPALTGKSINNEQEISNYQTEPAFVIRVIDGDTIETDKGEIRLLGVNTPEKGKAYYPEAKDFLKQIENQSIEILRDNEDLDKYERKLRYVFYENRLINIEILENGLATSFMINDLKYKDKIKKAEDFAKNNKIGLWKKSRDICAACIWLVELNPNDEFFIIKNSCSFQCNLSGWLVKDDANHFFKLNNLQAGEQEKHDSKTEIWNNDGDRFFMRDDKGELVVFWEY